MSVQQPAWLKRTRPCPFFSQGRCLFADSCNFLHDVKVRHQPLPSASHVQLPPKPVFHPPSVVVDSTSPHLVSSSSSESLASPVQDSSRYSGLLSVLSDVIGPPSLPIAARVSSANPSSLQNTAYGPGLLSESSLADTGLDLSDDVINSETGQGSPACSDPFSMPHLDSEATLVGPSGCGMESYFLEEDEGSATKFLPVPDETGFVDGNATPDFVEDSETFAIGSEGSSDDEDHEEENFAMVVSNRHSTLSSFTGASLLASPRNSVFGQPRSIEDSTVDLLSPVELSAKLRPFSIASLRTKRGDSIDSGYADGDGWVGPLPFPHTPPRNFRSSVTFLSHSRQTSRPFSAHKDRRVSYDVGAVRLSSHDPIEGIKEVEFDECSEDGLDEGTPCIILDAYDRSPSGELGENKVHDHLQVNLTDTKVKVKDAPSAMRTPRQYPVHPRPREEYDMDSCNQPSFVSDDSLSFKTALSVSYETVSDVSRVSPVKLDFLLPSISRCSTSNTSVLSHYSESSGHLLSNVCESSTGLGSQFDNTGLLEAKASVESLLPKNSDIDSNAVLASAGADEHLQKIAMVHGSPQGVIDLMKYAPSVSRINRSFPRSPAPAESSHNQPLPKDLGHVPQGADDSNEWVHLARRVANQSSAIENCLGSDEIIQNLDSESGNLTQRLSFPLPPPFLSAEFVGHSTLSGEDSSVLPAVAVMNIGGGSETCTMSQQEKVQQVLSGSDLTEKMRPNDLPQSPDTDAEFTSRRSRAASDLTVKGKSSPVTIHESTPYTLKSEEEQADLVNSLYEYIDSTLPLNLSSALGKPLEGVRPQRLDPAFPRGLSPCSNGGCSNSGTDSPRSETVLRPLLTGRRSFLRSSLAELIPKGRLGSTKGASAARLSTRLQVKEIGSTMVPLGFKRHRPQIQSSQTTSLPLHAALPSSQLREALRIRTDLAQEALPQGCSSATHVSFATRSPLPIQSMSAPPTGGLKQLQLSSVINERSSTLSTHSSSIASSILSLDHLFNASTPQSPSVSSTTSFSHNSLLSFSCKQIPEQIHHTLQRSFSSSSIQQPFDDADFMSQLSSTRHDLQSVSAPVQQSKSWRLSHYRAGSRNHSQVDNTNRLSRASVLSLPCAVDEEQEIDYDGPTISLASQSNHTDGWTHPAPIPAPSVHAIATPKPTLLFAIASDDVDQVRQVLESGDAGPNDSVGPQSALAFTLTNDKLTHKSEIVKALLAYGANPSALRNPALNPPPCARGAGEPSALPPETTLEGMDPATRYFVTRADAAHTRQTSQLIYRSFFRPLTRVRYDVIGQDWALEQLFRVLSMHSQKLAVAPIVVLLCGPSGHGKSLLARKFGFLLDVPTHTVNVTTLRSAHDIWQSYSMSPYEEPSSCTLAEFLIENEGKRCVVVLDEIEKVEEQKVLWSLLMPWELGRCSLEAGKRHVDARNVIWLATSNVGHELVFEYHEKRSEPDSRMSHEDYLELTALLRPRVSHCLGASLVSRVTTVLPFVPFTLDEKKAIAAEAIYAFVGEASKMSPQEVESSVMKALPSYHPSEGARSLHRAISNILMDAV